MITAKLRESIACLMLFLGLATAGVPRQPAKGVVYKDQRYGFAVTLPVSWKGFQIIAAEWTGVDGQTGRATERGPQFTIRHPLWTEAKPRQDIPIMVFTLAQWDKSEKEQIVFGAAPIGPSELGRNRKFVFALPARYNFAFPEGFEEVEDIVRRKSLKAFDAAPHGPP